MDNISFYCINRRKQACKAGRFKRLFGLFYCRFFLIYANSHQMIRALPLRSRQGQIQSKNNNFRWDYGGCHIYREEIRKNEMGQLTAVLRYKVTRNVKSRTIFWVPGFFISCGYNCIMKAKIYRLFRKNCWRKPDNYVENIKILYAKKSKES